MKLIDLIKSEKPSLSLEVFPPKNSAVYASIEVAVEKIASFSPSFMSVTYGAGGGTSDYTVSIAAGVQKRHNIPVLAHLTCVNSTKAGVRKQLDLMKESGIENIMALRGDLEPGRKVDENWDYQYASQLIEEVKEYGGFCIGGACYPEVHPESRNQRDDIYYLRQKVDAGCDFLTTQMFFDNNTFYNFLYKIRDAGIAVPVVPGIMPVTNVKQISRINTLSGAMIPQQFRYILDRFGDNPATMQQAGIAYATSQIVDLFANGISCVHVYSMNKPNVAQSILSNLSEILK